MAPRRERNKTKSWEQACLNSAKDLVRHGSIHNDDGVWLRLNEETIKKYVPNMNGYTEAWCLSFNQHLGKSLLVPVDVSERWFLKASELHSILIINLSLIKAFQF